jgi:hypothetical protein
MKAVLVKLACVRPPRSIKRLYSDEMATFVDILIIAEA